MRKILAVTAITFILALSAVLPAQAGKIVVTNDEWTLSNTGFSGLNDPGQFALNVAQWFTGNSTGNSFLVYSSNFGLTGSSLSSVMIGAGNAWTVDTVTVPTLSYLQSFKGVFLAGNGIDNQLLIDYVNGGGNVFLEGGTGIVGAAAEAAQWKAFLNAFGLEYGTSYNGVGGNIPISSPHPIFAGVDSLYQDNGNDALDINLLDPSAQVLVTVNGHGLYAVYESVSVPEPGTLILLGCALLGLFGLRRKVSA
jgi:hypothetical protein